MMSAGLHESDARGVVQHHPHARLQLMGHHGTRVEGEVRLAEPGNGLLEQQRAGTGLPCLPPATQPYTAVTYHEVLCYNIVS